MRYIWEGNHNETIFCNDFSQANEDLFRIYKVLKNGRS